MRQTVKNLFGLALFSAIGFVAACQPAATNVNTNGNSNVNSANVSNSNSNSANVNALSSNVNTADTSGAVIETKEPEQYQATVTLKFEVSGAQNLATAPLKANVARNGQNRWMEFDLPNGEKLIYLDREGKQFAILPNRKQYAELNKESIGVDPRRLLMPEQIVNQVKNLKGVERVGEEKVGDRDAIKYQYGATTDTKSQAGTVQTESVVFVDKETNLPLRSVTNAASQNGNVQGMKGLSLVTEMSNLKTTADANLFEVPQGYARVEPEQVKAQINLVFSAAAALLGQVMNQPAATPTP